MIIRDRITDIIRRCDGDTAVMPPTEVYNEGWLLRLVIDAVERTGDGRHPLSVLNGGRWYSEALLASRFLPRRRPDPLAESHTHADAVLGHFSLRRGEVVLDPAARQFEVIEAKLGSPLSSGTKNASDFDQAARNVGCMIHLVAKDQCAVQDLQRFSFTVMAPAAQIASGLFGDLVTDASVRRKILSRVQAYEGEYDEWHRDVFEATVNRLQIRLESWENIIGLLVDADARSTLTDFYERCLAFNPMRVPRAPDATAS